MRTTATMNFKINLIQKNPFFAFSVQFESLLAITHSVRMKLVRFVQFILVCV